MDKITVVCHKDHVVSYEDYRSQCLLCLVEDLMREVGRLTAVCKEKEWVGLTDDEIKEIVGPWGDTPIKGYTRKLFDQIEAKLKEKNT